MADYYVKNGGNDYASGLSDAEAWSTIGKVNSFSFSDNDTVSFSRNSVFTDATLTLVSTSGGRNGIVIQDYGIGNKPLFNGNIIRPIDIEQALVNFTIRNIDISGQCRSDTTYHNMYINNMSGLTIDGLYGDGHYSYNGSAEGRNPVGIDRCSGEVEVMNCELHDWGPSVIPSAGIDYNAFTIREHINGTFLMHDNLINNMQSSAISCHRCSASAYIYNNTAYNCGQKFVAIYASDNIEIYNNHAYRESTFIGRGGVEQGPKTPFVGIFTNEGDETYRLTQNMSIHDNIFGPTDQAITNISGKPEIAAVNNVVINNNTIIDCDAAFNFGMNVTNVAIYKNVVFNAFGSHIFDWGGSANENINIFNNTFHSDGLNTSVYFSNSNINLYNNIFYNSANSHMLYVDRGEPTIYNNIWYNPLGNDYIDWKGTIYTSSQQTDWRNAGHSGEIFANPLFVDPVNDDFRPQITSPAVDAGVNVGLPFVGLAQDIGAFEYGEDDLCEGVTCPDYCDNVNHIRYYNGICDPSTGECVYDTEIDSVACGFDPCEGILPNWICEVNMGGENTGWKTDQNNCHDAVYDVIECPVSGVDPCDGVTCEDFCDNETHTRYFDGVCDPSTGECVYAVEENSVECGYVPPEGEANNDTVLFYGSLGLLALRLFNSGKETIQNR